MQMDSWIIAKADEWREIHNNQEKISLPTGFPFADEVLMCFNRFDCNFNATLHVACH